MKLERYLKEENLSYDDVITLLKRDVDSKFLRSVRAARGFIYRAIKNPPRLDMITKVPHKNRKPTDTPYLLHHLADMLFKDKFGWRVRSGIFTCGDIGQFGAGYQYRQFLFFPIGKFEFVWSSDIGDFYTDLERILDREMGEDIYSFKGKDKFRTYDQREEIKEHMLDLINTYKSSNLKGAIQSDNEIVFRCKKYYLVNMEFEDDLEKELILG